MDQHNTDVTGGDHTKRLDTDYFSPLIPGIDDTSMMPPPVISSAESYFQSVSYRRVSKNVNGVENKHICHQCNWHCTNSSNLKAHIRTHTGEKPFVCPIPGCPLAFGQHSNLKAHYRTHTGEKPFQCDVCGQSFSRSSHLTGHKRTHTGEKPYICGVCGESFSTSTHLRNHVKRHNTTSPYTCTICEVSFAHNAQLLAHVKVHIGQRPYKCCDCRAIFHSKADLRIHRRIIHSDERPFICGKCGKTFKTYQYLGKHLKKCTVLMVDDDDDEEDQSPTEIVRIKEEPNFEGPGMENDFIGGAQLAQINLDTLQGETIQLTNYEGLPEGYTKLEIP